MSIRKLACIGRMNSKNQNQFAFFYHNEGGFTFLNMLLTFFIYSLIISTFAIILHILLSHSQHENDLKPFEWELFVIQLHSELKEARDIAINETEITFINKQGQFVSINHYQNVIRRQVIGKGHEIYLFKVKTVDFSYAPKGVHISVISTAGKDYHYTFRSFKDLIKS